MYVIQAKLSPFKELFRLHRLVERSNLTMKREHSTVNRTIGTLIVVVLLALYSANLIAATCTPDDITLNSQTEVDEFQTNHGPDCDTIVGNLRVGGNDITNLIGLFGLTQVGNDLSIYYNSALTNLDGLNNLSAVGGNLGIGDNDALLSLDGLNSLTTVGGSFVIFSDNLLPNLNGLENLTSIGIELRIHTNFSITQIDALSNLTSVGSVWILYNWELANLDGLSGLRQLGVLSIFANLVLSDLNGLSGLTFLNYLRIESNPKLTNLNGLSNIEGVEEDVEVFKNETLSDCYSLSELLDAIDDPPIGPGPGVAGVPDVGGNVVLFDNATGCNSITEIDTIFKDSFES